MPKTIAKKAKRPTIAKKSKHKTSSDLHTLTVCLSGSGTQAYAYIVDDEFLKKLSKSDSDSDNDNSPIDLDDELTENAIDTYLVCWGMTEDADIDIKLDGEPIPFEGPVDEDSPRDWEPDEPTDLLVYGYLEAMGRDLKIPEGTHLIIEIIEYDNGTLHTAMEIPESSICASELKLLRRDVDTDAEMSLATYENGLLNEVEFDVFSLAFKDLISDFDLDFSGISSGGYYLVKKDSSGSWRGYETIRY
jgi:hypothetical protein